MAKQSWWRRLIDGKDPTLPEDAPAPPSEREPALEAGIERDPESIEPYLIYADWLQDRGDPRGEPIARRIEPLWPRARTLDTIVLQGFNLSLATSFEAPALRSLELVTDDLDPQTLGSLARSELPALDTLILWLGGTTYRPIGRGEIRVLGAMALPNLRDLGLVKCQCTDDALEVLVDAPWFSQLRVLDLSRGTLTARGIAILESARDRLSALGYLDVSQNRLDDEACVRARTLAARVRTQWP